MWICDRESYTCEYVTERVVHVNMWQRERESCTCEYVTERVVHVNMWQRELYMWICDRENCTCESVTERVVHVNLWRRELNVLIVHIPYMYSILNNDIFLYNYNAGKVPYLWLKWRIDPWGIGVLIDRVMTVHCWYSIHFFYF